MRPTAAVPRASHAGFTLIELLLALALVSIVFVALVELLDTTMTIWERTETGRELEAVSGGVLDLLERDLRALEGGARGDLLFQWRQVDLDRDGAASAPYPLLRLVRQASAAELATLEPDLAVDARAVDLVEVCWALVPPPGDDPATRSVGVLMRGTRRLGDEESLSFFDPDFLDARGAPLTSALEVVSEGVLWLGVRFAAQTSVVHEGWTLGEDLRDVARSWDAWGRGRADEELTAWNRPHAGQPRATDAPVLPRRLRLELELERPAETTRRPDLDLEVDAEDGRLELDDERYLPPAGAFVLVEEEWMEVLGVRGARLDVRRGARGTRAVPHPAGAKVHFGAPQLRDVPVALYREDWNL